MGIVDMNRQIVLNLISYLALIMIKEEHLRAEEDKMLRVQILHFLYICGIRNFAIESSLIYLGNWTWPNLYFKKIKKRAPMLIIS